MFATAFYTEGKQLYRSKEERKNDTKVTKATWFRELGTTTTLKVPMTKNSELAKKLRQALAVHQGPKGTSVKVVEQPGIPILSGLAKNDPFKTNTCHIGECPLGDLPCSDKCGQENIVYTAICTRCRDKQIDEGTDPRNVIHRQYIGESSHTLRVRA